MVLKVSNYINKESYCNKNEWNLLRIIKEWNKIKLNKVKSINCFSNWKKWVWNVITKAMKLYYEFEDENFKQAFEIGKYNILNTKNLKKRRKFLDLMCMRNKAYNEILLKAVKEWKFDDILSKKEKHNLRFLLESWILTAFDKARKNIILDILENKYKDVKFYDDEFYYGHLQKEIIKWNSTVEVFKILSWKKYFKNLNKFKQFVFKMKESYLKSYLEWFFNLLEQDKINPKDYLKLEKNEIKSWQKQEKLTFTVPMENYYLPNFVDLEFSLYLANYLPKEQKNNFVNLSRKYFNDDFGIKNLTLANVEVIATWWESTFLKVLWKSFPNDYNLSKQIWKIVYISEDMLKDNSRITAKLLKKIWFNINLNSYTLINKYIIYFHEIWHSLFLNNKPSNTILEELKATLFYYLSLYDKMSQISKDNIENILKYILWEFAKKISLENNLDIKQYWIRENFILAKAIRNNLIVVKDNKIKLNYEFENFANFLKDLKDSLFKIKEIYKISDVYKRKKAELDFIGNSFEITKKAKKFINHKLNNGKN